MLGGIRLIFVCGGGVTGAWNVLPLIFCGRLCHLNQRKTLAYAEPAFS